MPTLSATHADRRRAFYVFRTQPSKSRLNFLSLLRGKHEDYVLNEAALDYLRRRQVDPPLMRSWHVDPQNCSLAGAVLEHLARSAVDIFDRPLMRALSEARTLGSASAIMG